MTTDPRGRKSIIMECGAAVWFDNPPPVRGEIVFCPKHRAREKVMNAPAIYRGKCRQCSAGRKYGTMLGLALREMDRHIRNRPTHTMDLYDGYVMVDTIAAQLVEIPYGAGTKPVDDPPPF
jgi:hypothetical protein